MRPGLTWWKELLCVAGACFIADASLAAQQFNFTRYDEALGLPQAQILALHQDKQGFVWVGTYGGVARFDGTAFRSYQRRDGLTSNTVEAITEDFEGRLVVGVDGGVCTMVKARFECVSWKPAVGGDRSIDVLPERDGGRWVATNKGLVHVDKRGAVRALAVPGTAGSTSLTRDRAGRIWVATNAGLAELRDNAVVLRDLPGINGQLVRTVRFTGSHVLVTTARGVFRLADGIAVALPGTAELANTEVNDAVVGPDSVVWVATHRGILRVRNGVSQHLTRQQGLSDDVVNQLLVDREGDLWLSTEAGLSRMSANPFRHMSETDGLPHRFVRALAEDSDGKLWVGTRDGIAWLDGDRFVPAPIKSVDKIRVFAIAPLQGNGILVATSRGLVHYNKGQAKWYGVADGLPGEGVLALLPDSNGTIWIGTRTGIARWVNGKIATLGDTILAKSSGVSLARDSRGRLWVGMATGGILIYDGTKTTRLNESNGLSDQPIWAIARDSKGRMWAGSNGDGAFRISESGAIEHFGAEEGLQSLFVWQVLVDRLDRVWMYTNLGMERFENGDLRHIGRGDGLVDLEGSANASLEARDGALWFGTGYGVTRYLQSEDHGTATRLPEVFIEGITTGSRSVPLTNARVAPGRGGLQISYTSPMYRDAENIRFRYRISGDLTWSEPIASRSFSIAGLAPGDHVIEVIAVDGYGRSSTHPARQLITVLPAFWQSWWFRVFAVLALGGLSAAVPLFRARRLGAEGERLEREVLLRTTQLAEQTERLEREAAERESAQVELQRSEERLRDIVEHATNLFYSHTLDSVLTYASPQSQALLGVSPEAMRRSFREFVTDNPNNALALNATQRAIETGEKQPPYELELRHASGELVYVLVHEAPVVVENKVQAIVGSLTNITAEKQSHANEERLAEQLRQAQKMEAIGRLTGGIAHDFNNLLTAISANAEVVLDTLDGEHEVREDVKGILGAAGRAASLVAQLMAFSRQQLIKRRTIDLNVLVLESARMLQRIVGSDLTLAVVPSESAAWILADDGQIDQVLINLTANARDAMPNGGQVQIGVSRETHARPLADDVPAGSFVVLSVSDTGTGMDAQTMSRIFEPFFTTKNVGEGTGLGLAMVYGVVKQNSGHVAVSSTPGVGTTVRIYLPESAPATAVQAEVQPALPESSGEHNGDRVILVVDDEEMVRNVVCRALRSYGYQVMAAPEGTSAVALASQFKDPIHLLLCDVVMPGMSGKEVAEKLSLDRPDMQVLFMTGHTNGMLGARGLLPDDLEVIHKPFRTNELKLRVERLLDGALGGRPLVA